MFGIEFIEVGIGLFFAFFALATICSTIVEIISKLLHLRSNNLRSTLGELLGEKEVNGIVEELYEHKLISTDMKKRIAGITYIDAKDFANAVLDILGGSADNSTYEAFLDKVSKWTEEPIQAEFHKILNASSDKLQSMAKDAQSYFKDSAFVNKAIELLRSFPKGSTTYEMIVAAIDKVPDELVRKQLMQILDTPDDMVDDLQKLILEYAKETDFAKALFSLLGLGAKEHVKFGEIEKRIQDFGDEKIRDTLMWALKSGSGSLDGARESIENWFNRSMNELSGWYKRRMRFMVGTIAVIVVCSLNADTVRLTRELWNDNELRTATIKAAEDMVGKQISAATDPSNTDTTLTSMVDNLKRQVNEVHQVPLGWNTEVIPCFDSAKNNTEDVLWWWANKLLGLLISIGAVSMGATYWYKQLKSLLNLRFNLGGGGGGGGTKS